MIWCIGLCHLLQAYLAGLNSFKNYSFLTKIGIWQRLFSAASHIWDLTQSSQQLRHLLDNWENFIPCEMPMKILEKPCKVSLSWIEFFYFFKLDSKMNLWPMCWGCYWGNLDGVQEFWQSILNKTDQFSENLNYNHDDLNNLNHFFLLRVEGLWDAR